MNTMRSTRGFTLIELLVVVAIIGLLASIVIASLNTARMKGRDARRVADVKQISLALEMYNDANSQYATTTSTSSIGSYISVVPTDPKSNSAYSYAALQGSPQVATTCASYHLLATLEQASSTALSSAAGKQSGGTYPAQDGATCTNGGTDSNGGGQVFDVRP